MSRTTKIFGPPGTGKTTRLLNIVDEAMASGIQPERIAYMSFTKKAADEAVARAQDRFKFPVERFPHFRTLHSMAFRHLYARRDDMMQTEQFRELGDMLGFQFTDAKDLDDWTGALFNLPIGTALGDKVERIQSLSRLRNVTLEEQWHESNFRDVPWLAVGQWAEGLKRFKESRGMMDFTDLLEEYDAPLDVDLFIIDEAQDLSPLQWKVVKNAASSARRIFLAGDDDQCIYGWAGADVRRFLNIAGQSEVLPVSFRLPRTIHKLADEVAQGIEVRQPKDWKSREEEGAVNRIMSERTLDLSKGKWLLLARNHIFLRRFEDVCQNQGYSYLRDGRHSTNDATVRGIVLWESWRKGAALKPREVRTIAAIMPALENFQPSEDVLLKDAPISAQVKRQNWMDALEVQPRKREYIRACLANRENLKDEPRINISTIHKVKGGEADHVVLIPDLTPNPWDELNTDDEQRVLYVAVTRAKQTLTIVQPQAARHYRV